MHRRARHVTNDWGIHRWLQSILGSLHTLHCSSCLLWVSEDKLGHFYFRLEIWIPNIHPLKNVPGLNQSHPELNIKKRQTIRSTLKHLMYFFRKKNPVFVDLRLLPRRNVGGRTPLTKGIKELAAAKTVKNFNCCSRSDTTLKLLRISLFLKSSFLKMKYFPHWAALLKYYETMWPDF